MCQILFLNQFYGIINSGGDGGDGWGGTLCRFIYMAHFFLFSNFQEKKKSASQKLLKKSTHHPSSHHLSFY
jgi:hypothetical protein